MTSSRSLSGDLAPLMMIDFDYIIIVVFVINQFTFAAAVYLILYRIQYGDFRGILSLITHVRTYNPNSSVIRNAHIHRETIARSVTDFILDTYADIDSSILYYIVVFIKGNVMLCIEVQWY